MYESIETLLQLHEQIEIIYVVDGYEAKLATSDGDISVHAAHGKTVAEALERLNSEISHFKNVDDMRKKAFKQI